MELEEQVTTKKYFTRINNNNKLRCKNTIYDIYFCIKTDICNDEYIGSWVSTIEKDNLYNKTNEKIKISGDEKGNHVRIRLNGILETLLWVVGNTNSENFKYITVNLFSNDPFVINLLTQWIPLWMSNNFYITENDERPNRDLLIKISNISSKINLKAQWFSENSPEMTNINNIVTESISKLSNE